MPLDFEQNPAHIQKQRTSLMYSTHHCANICCKELSNVYSCSLYLLLYSGITFRPRSHGRFQCGKQTYSAPNSAGFSVWIPCETSDMSFIHDVKPSTWIPCGNKWHVTWIRTVSAWNPHRRMGRGLAPLNNANPDQWQNPLHKKKIQGRIPQGTSHRVNIPLGPHMLWMSWL